MRVKQYISYGLSACLVAVLAAGCGGGGSDSTSTTGVTGTVQAGEASVKSLASTPTVDLSSYDNSTKTSASISVPKSTGKGLGADIGAVGNPSRAGCEANMQKKEVIRHSLETALDRCWPEAMEQAGLITIPDGSYALYAIVPPKMDDSQQGGMCDDIPAQDTERLAACQAEAKENNAGGGGIKIRTGKIDGKFHIDMCFGKEGAEVRESEATYGASGSVYTATATRKGTWMGNSESNTFDITVDLGKTGTVTDGIPSLGTDGSVVAKGKMNGGFGSGLLNFELLGSDSSNRVSGAFKGGFKDPVSGLSLAFTGKVYSRFGGSSGTGCAKFSFSGTVPPMRCDQMLPPNMPLTDVSSFLSVFSQNIGIDVNINNYKTLYVCPNDNFNPSDPTSKPMIKANSDNSCPSMTDTGVECYSIKNVTQTTTFGTKTTQTYKIIAKTGSPHYDEVNAFDVAALDPATGDIAFSRVWPCDGTFTKLDFGALTPTQIAGIDKYLNKCFLLEEKARGEGGMGDHNCHQAEIGQEVQDSYNEGPPPSGIYAGDHARDVVGGNCPLDKTSDRLFVDTINKDTNEYCMNSGTATCQKFKVTSNNTTGLSLSTSVAGVTVTGLNYTQSGTQPATQVTMTFSTGQGSCQMAYNITQPTFSKPAEFGSDPVGVPEICVKAGLTKPEDGDACGQLCQNNPGSCGPK